MSSARGWFTKRVNPPGSKSPKDLTRSISTEKLPLHVDGNKSPGNFKFNTFAAVIGKKPKKPSLAFQNPSSPSSPPNAPVSDRSDSSRYTNRPPAKSISSTVRSGDDSNEPRTPSDVPKDRMSFPRSIFTLSDSDPFAAGAISVPYGIADSGRESVFSNSSPIDSFSKKNDSVLPFGRTSIASTSSQSHGNPVSPLLAKLPSASDSPKNSMGTLLQNIDPRRVPPEEGFLTSRWECIPRPTLAKCGSAVTLTDKKSSETPTVPRPPSRSRWYTESNSHRDKPAISRLPRKSSTPPDSEVSSLAPFLQGTAPSLSRKSSASRFAKKPPSAPPLHDLPAPPVSGTHSDDTSDDGPSPAASGPTSSISFALCPSERDFDDGDSSLRYRPLKDKPDGPGSDCTPGGTRKPHPLKDPSHNSLADIICQRSTSSARASAASSGHTLRKSMSHSALQKSKLGNQLSPPPPLPSKPGSVEKDLEKQHSFHQLRLQTPSVPQLSQANSAIVSSSDTSLPTEPRRPVTNSPPVSGRRRLFSGSSHRRPSTGTAEDDLLSVFSFSTDAERPHGIASLHAGSLLDEGDSESVPTGAVALAPDYAQQIMSPAEMLKVEAVVQSEFDSKYGELLRNRQRNVAFTSASTPLLGAMYVKEGLSPAPTSFPRFPSRTPSNSSGVPSHLAVRSSTAQDVSYSSSPISTSPVSPTVGLPPPPRSWTRPHAAETTHNVISSQRSSNIPVNPLSPPPWKCCTRASVNGDKAPHKSMMRKPSFLEIVDDAPSYEGSFLDFDSGKESLDLPRDDDIGLATSGL
ncbi:hypothetical protein BS17DRAFT_751167 [Gyrodon lividus]|nr:hypothetical protein BS17DRAFT_751167 [Gyrodon lividus]